MKASSPHIAPSIIWPLLICLVPLLVYWPISLGVFALKNDALTYFLPFRYHMSEALRMGRLPLWNPYLFTGIPLHADMQSGVWNPVAMLLALLRPYDLSSLHAETLCYITLAGLGFYTLGRYLKWLAPTAFFGAVSYQSSAFFIDSASFIPWVAAAAYLPWVAWAFLRVRQLPVWSNSLLLALTIALLFTAGYPSFFIFSVYTIAVILIVDALLLARKQLWAPFARLAGNLFLAALIWLLLCSPALVSYYNFLPYYQRGEGTSLAMAHFNPFAWQHSGSLFFGPAAYRMEAANDITSRNLYVGLAAPLLLIQYARRRWSRRQVAFGIFTLVAFLFCLGPATPLRGLLYHTLPLMDTFRHPGSMRIMVVLGMLLLAGERTQAMQPEFISKRTILSGGLVITVLFVLCFSLVDDHQALHVPKGFEKAAIKQLIDASGPKFWLLCTFIIQLLTLGLLLFVRRPALQLGVLLANLVIFAWLAMPFTAVSQHSAEQVNAFIKRYPGGYPADSLNLPLLSSNDRRIYRHPFGYTAFYEKRLSIQDEIVSPTVPTAYKQMVHDSVQRQIFTGKPLLFLKSGKTPVQLVSFNANRFDIRVTSSARDTLIIQQNYHHHWQATVNGTAAHLSSAARTFMQIAVPVGTTQVVLEYKPPFIRQLASIACATTLFIVLALVQYKRRQNA